MGVIGGRVGKALDSYLRGIESSYTMLPKEGFQQRNFLLEVSVLTGKDLNLVALSNNLQFMEKQTKCMSG